MSIASRNKSFNKVEWGVDTKELKFKKCSELEVGREYPLLGCFITPDNGYGLGAVLITEGFLVNVSNRLVETIQEICNNADDIEQIKSGKAGFKISTYESKQFHKTCYDVEFTDR